MVIEVKNVVKNFSGFPALRDVSLEVPGGELVALLGPSGSGKTTLLRIIAGLETPDRGRIYFNGEDATNRKARERKAGFVFQHYALFRRMTVFENVAFGLQVKRGKEKLTRAAIRQKVGQLLELVQMESLAGRYPSQLSGGQRQRVALARALAVEPRVMLFDEPFGALDAKVRKELRRWVRQLHDEIGLTGIFVTHDQEEALEIADRIVVLNEGQIEQVGAPEEVYERPANAFVCRFLGNVNLFHGRARAGLIKIGQNEFAAPETSAYGNEPAVAYVRPHELELERGGRCSGGIKAEVCRFWAVGAVVKVELKRSDTGEMFEAELTRERFTELKPRVGETVSAKFKRVRVFPEMEY